MVDPNDQPALRITDMTASAAVFSHPVLLNGMVRNLMRNTIDYTPRGGRVFVACRRHGSHVHLQVRDSGIGIPGEELGRSSALFTGRTQHAPRISGSGCSS
jgi:signal transduction histidine kinase